MMRSEPNYKLKIIAGLHQDAELFLDPDVRYCIGSGDECDIILLDSGVGQRHLSFTISQGRIQLEPSDIEIYVDGTAITDASFALSEFQVVTLGQAHLAIGPAKDNWPPLMAPEITKEDEAPMTRALVLMNPDHNLPQAFPPEGFFQKLMKSLQRWNSFADKKMAATACAFLLALTLFVYDTWRTCPPMTTVAINAAGQTGLPPAPRKSMLLSMVNRISNAQHNTLVGAGLAEPTVPTHAEPFTDVDDPVSHIRQVLKSTWGNNLTETRIDNRSIQFTGYDREHQHKDLVLNLEQNEAGQMDAQGVTLTPRKKKAILSHLGDIIRVKVDVTEDMENVCQRVLEKKGVRQAKAKFDLEDNTFTLQGRSDKRTIATISDIVAKAFPNIAIDNKIKTNRSNGKRLEISGVSTSGAPHVIMQDGSKVFSGGKLENGCTIGSIENDHIILNCYGTKRKHRL